MAPLRIDLFRSGLNKGGSLITFFNFIPRKLTLTILVPGVPHRYHEKKNFFFDELKLDMIVESRVLITNIIMIAHKTPLVLKYAGSLY